MDHLLLQVGTMYQNAFKNSRVDSNQTWKHIFFPNRENRNVRGQKRLGKFVLFVAQKCSKIPDLSTSKGVTGDDDWEWRASSTKSAENNSPKVSLTFVSRNLRGRAVKTHDPQTLRFRNGIKSRYDFMMAIIGLRAFWKTTVKLVTASTNAKVKARRKP